MQPHASFEPYHSSSRPQSYSQQPAYLQQKGASSPVPGYALRNNYHYNYSPGTNLAHKPMNNTAQEPFYRPHQKAEFQRPFSNKDKKDNFADNSSKNQVDSQNQVSSRPLILNDNTNFLAQFSRPLMLNDNTNFLAQFSPTLFPKTSKLLDLHKFITENLKLRSVLLQQLQKIKNKMHHKSQTLLQENQTTKSSTRDTTPKRISQDKSSILHNLHDSKPQTNPNLSPALTQQQQLAHLLQLKSQKQHLIQQQKQNLAELKQTSSQTRQQLHKLQSETLNQSIHETPLLKEKQLAIESLSVQVEWMNEKSTELRRLANTKQDQQKVFEMYQKMCRQVQTLRKQNNKKSQRLKKLFQKTNQLTHKQQNVNMFLMNLKV